MLLLISSPILDGENKTPAVECKATSQTPSESSMVSSISQRKQHGHRDDSIQTNGYIRQPQPHPQLMPPLVFYNELPPWYQENEFIRGGYRAVSNSTSASFGSWTYIHNETFNIYSHFVPSILFLAAQGFVSSLIDRQYPEATTGDRLIFAFFLLTATITLTLSFTYHTLMNHSLHLSHLWLRIDYLAIVFLTLGDFVSGIYLGFFLSTHTTKSLLEHGKFFRTSNFCC